MTTSDATLQTLARLASSNSEAVSNFGARLVVFSRFFSSVLPLLTPDQCRDTLDAFRISIEEAMAATDDVPMPAEYHDTLLDYTNRVLAVLQDRA